MINLLAAVLTCVIVVPTDMASPSFVYDHEIAHCNGWTHGPDGNNLANVFPPKGLVHAPAMKLIVKSGTPKETTRICKAAGAGSYACQWFEE